MGSGLPRLIKGGRFLIVRADEADALLAALRAAGFGATQTEGTVKAAFAGLAPDTELAFLVLDPTVDVDAVDQFLQRRGGPAPP
jgi:hypothetical protein